jgi:bifunctional DNA-binding transcriptional regulator/antitoxin component of YhaV-PrlF toxin-antitoxin module
MDARREVRAGQEGAKTMSVSTTLQIRTKGSLTLPVELRRKYGLNEGDIMTLVDLGDGAFVLYSGVTAVDRLGDRVAQLMAEEGVSLDEVLEALDEERQRYYQERYLATRKTDD